MLTDFPGLHSIELELENDISRIDAAIRDVKTNERYADSTSERQYQLNILAQERVQTLADAETAYQSELELTERTLADRAFTSIDITEEARATVQAITTSVTTSVNPVDTLSLLNVKARGMSDDEKTLLALELATLADVAHGKAIGDDAKADDRGRRTASTPDKTGQRWNSITIPRWIKCERKTKETHYIMEHLRYFQAWVSYV